jgi:hypothetical protein
LCSHSWSIFVLNDKTFDFFGLSVFGPNDDQVSVSITDPSFVSMDSVFIVSNFSDSSLQIRGIRSNFLLSQAPSSDKFKAFDFRDVFLFLFLTAKNLNS